MERFMPARFACRALLAAPFFVLLTGCITYRIEQTAIDETVAAKVTSDSAIQVSKTNTLYSGMQCFEPMLMVVTLGIIPAHCVNTYEARLLAPTGASSQALGSYAVTSYNGWVALLMAPLPQWQYGHMGKADVAIKRWVLSQRDGE
jgi:hypothetical protein